MKVNYNVILESYVKSNNELFDETLLDAALEAAATEDQMTGKEPDTNKSSNELETEVKNEVEPSQKTKSTILDKIKNFIEKIAAIISNARVKILNRLKLLFETDKGFFKTLYSRRASVKPMKGFKAINYKYSDQYLEMTVKKIGKESLATIKALSNLTSEPSDTRVKDILAAENKSIGQILLAPYSETKDESLEVNMFIKELIDKYRGKKEEILYTESMIPQLMQQAQSSSGISNEANQMIAECQNSLNNLKVLEGRARSAKDTNSLKEVSNRVAKAAAIYNTYLTIVKMYYELKLEHSLSTRALLRKFYQF